MLTARTVTLVVNDRLHASAVLPPVPLGEEPDKAGPDKVGKRKILYLFSTLTPKRFLPGINYLIYRDAPVTLPYNGTKKFETLPV
jgi:hypothetical protein